MGLFSWLAKGKRQSAPEAQGPEPSGDTVEELAEQLGSSNGAARVDAARALLEHWRTGDVKAAETIVDRLPALFEDNEPQARVAALAAVRMMRKPENLEKNASAVLALLADPVAQVRTAAVWTAVRLPGAAAREQVRAVLRLLRRVRVKNSQTKSAAGRGRDLDELSSLYWCHGVWSMVGVIPKRNFPLTDGMRA